MMIVGEDFIDKHVDINTDVFTNQALSDGAIVLYGYLYYLKTTQMVTDKDILAALNISQKTLVRRKRELRALDLILTMRADHSLYILFVGSIANPASKIKDNWKKTR